MALRRLTTWLTIVGLVLVAAAAALTYLVVPSLSALPTDFEQGAQYEGTSASLDPATLELGEPSPVSAERTVKVIESDGDTAIISSSQDLVRDGETSTTSYDYAIDRHSFEQVDTSRDVADQKGGMVLSRAFHPSKAPFTVYDSTTRTAQTVTFVEKTRLAGRDVYYFEGTTTAPVKEPSVLAPLQEGIASSAGGDGTTMPSKLVNTFVADLPGENGEALRQALADAGDDVPVMYSSTNTTRIWIDTELGSPIRSGGDSTITAHTELGGVVLPLLTLNRTDLLATDASVKSSAAKTASNASTLAIAGTWVPLGLTVSGLVLLLVAMIRRRGEGSRGGHAPTARTGTPSRESVGAGR